MAVDKDRVMQKVQQLMRKGQWDKALDEMKGLHAEVNNDPMVSLRLGDLFLKAGKNNEAARSYYNTARLFARDGYTAKAIATYKMILRIVPDYEDVERRIGELALEKAAFSRTGIRPPQSGRADLPAAREQVGAIELSETTHTDKIIVQGIHSDTNVTETWNEDIAPVSGNDGVGVPDPTANEPAPQPIPLFSEIPKHELWDLIGRMEERIYAEGDMVVREGELGASLFIIKNGGVRVVTSVKGAEVVLAELCERDFFGEVSFLTGRPRTADIVANAPTVILELTRGELERLLERYPDIGVTLRMFHENRVSDTLTAFKAVSKETFG